MDESRRASFGVARQGVVRLVVDELMRTIETRPRVTAGHEEATCLAAVGAVRELFGGSAPTNAELTDLIGLSSEQASELAAAVHAIAESSGQCAQGLRPASSGRSRTTAAGMTARAIAPSCKVRHATRRLDCGTHSPLRHTAVTPSTTRLASLVRCAAFALGAICSTARADPDTLWRLIDTRCVPEALAGAAPAPCARVDLSPDRDHGWVALKDLKGPLQFLLMPTARITGIENPSLESPTATNYFAQAWRERDLLDARHGSPLARDAVSLTVNSRARRSQNQLHIHISCVRPELRARLLAAQADIAPTWAPLPGGWLRHAWFVRRVETTTLDAVDPFADVEAHVPGAAVDMGAMTIGVVATRFDDGKDGFVLMASAVDPADPSSGSAEDDLQDHACTLVGAAPAPR